MRKIRASRNLYWHVLNYPVFTHVSALVATRLHLMYYRHTLRNRSTLIYFAHLHRLTVADLKRSRPACGSAALSILPEGSNRSDDLELLGSLPGCALLWQVLRLKTLHENPISFCRWRTGRKVLQRMWMIFKKFSKIKKPFRRYSTWFSFT